MLSRVRWQRSGFLRKQDSSVAISSREFNANSSCVLGNKANGNQYLLRRSYSDPLLPWTVIFKGQSMNAWSCG